MREEATMGRRRAKNLLLDEEAVRWAEGYCEQHRTTLSRVVETYLITLPQYVYVEVKSPIVQRLVGAASGNPLEPGAYRDYLGETYRARERVMR
jgi:hypothetical protein